MLIFQTTTSDSVKQKGRPELREALGYLVDILKPGSGTTNDGKTARKFFRNQELSKSERATKSCFILHRFPETLNIMVSAFVINLESLRV